MKSSAMRRQSGFSLIELMVAIAIVGMLAAIAAPQLLGAREKAKHESCLNAMHVLDAELVNRLENQNALSDGDAALNAIDQALKQIEASENATNPRDFSLPAFDTVATTLFVPPPETSCTVYLIDGTDDHPHLAPTIVVTAYERGVNSFRLTLD